ncbi:MAG: serine hydrolase [Patescibacteria group bacterium]
MSRTNYQSLLFALLVLGFALVQKTESGAEEFRNQQGLKLYDPTFAAETIPTTREANIINTVPQGKKMMGSAQSVRFVPQGEERRITMPNLSAQAVFARDLGGPRIYAAKASDTVWPIASITKLMTAVIAEEMLNEENLITLSETAIATEGFSGDFALHDMYALSDMISAMLVISSNDAAYAIAEYMGYDTFVAEMNKKAGVLGMARTSYADPTGLSPINTSTPEDIEKLVSYILVHHPHIFEITKQPSITVRELTKNREHVIINNNAFSGRRDFLGGKTGYLDESLGNLISLFTFGEKQYLIILFGSQSRFNDTEKIYNAIRQI